MGDYEMIILYVVMSDLLVLLLPDNEQADMKKMHLLLTGMIIAAVLFSQSTAAFAADTSPPSVNIVFPLNGGTYTGTVTWSTTVTDNVGVSLVYFYIDGDFWQS